MESLDDRRDSARVIGGCGVTTPSLSIIPMTRGFSGVGSMDMGLHGIGIRAGSTSHGWSSRIVFMNSLSP